VARWHINRLFSYGLSNNALNRPDYSVSNDSIISVEALSRHLAGRPKGNHEKRQPEEQVAVNILRPSCAAEMLTATPHCALWHINRKTNAHKLGIHLCL
jgi:hypothetical protein